MNEKLKSLLTEARFPSDISLVDVLEVFMEQLRKETIKETLDKVVLGTNQEYLLEDASFRSGYGRAIMDLENLKQRILNEI